MKFVIIYGIGFLMLIALAIGMYKLQRWWNWNMDYKGQVKEYVRSVVKQECLK